MFLSVAQPNTCSKPVQKLNALKQQSDDSKFLPWQHYSRLQAVIEGFVDGVLILSDRGEWVYANTQARRICHSLSPEVSQSNAVAQEIWRVCQSLIDSHQIFPRETIIIESEVVTDGSASYRIRVRWLESDASQHSFLLVTLEDLHQSLENMAIADVKKYGLTPREAEVWLLRRSNYSYKEIAAKLDITSNTVKKHMKSIYAKQQMSEWDEQ
jgi:DNA-binding CsgD family transcriptional regulator